MITASGRRAPWGRRMRTDTWPDGPPGTVVSSMSTVGLLTGPDWTASMVLRPWSGPELKQERRVGVGVDDGLGLRLEVDGVGHDCLLRATAPESSVDGTATSRSDR